MDVHAYEVYLWCAAAISQCFHSFRRGQRKLFCVCSFSLTYISLQLRGNGATRCCEVHCRATGELPTPSRWAHKQNGVQKHSRIWAMEETSKGIRGEEIKNRCSTSREGHFFQITKKNRFSQLPLVVCGHANIMGFYYLLIQRRISIPITQDKPLT